MIFSHFGLIGSPTLNGHGPIEVNIYEETFLMLQGLLVGDERGSKNISRVSELAKCLDHGGRGSTLIIFW